MRRKYVNIEALISGALAKLRAGPINPEVRHVADLLEGMLSDVAAMQRRDDARRNYMKEYMRTYRKSKTVAEPEDVGGNGVPGDPV